MVCLKKQPPSHRAVFAFAALDSFVCSVLYQADIYAAESVSSWTCHTPICLKVYCCDTSHPGLACLSRHLLLTCVNGSESNSSGWSVCKCCKEEVDMLCMSIPFCIAIQTWQEADRVPLPGSGLQCCRSQSQWRHSSSGMHQGMEQSSSALDPQMLAL